MRLFIAQALKIEPANNIEEYKGQHLIVLENGSFVPTLNGKHRSTKEALGVKGKNDIEIHVFPGSGMAIRLDGNITSAQKNLIKEYVRGSYTPAGIYIENYATGEAVPLSRAEFFAWIEGSDLSISKFNKRSNLKLYNKK